MAEYLPSDPIIEHVKTSQPLKEYEMSPPFRKRVIFGHKEYLFLDFTAIPFPDGETRILTSCSDDKLRLFQVDRSSPEKRIKRNQPNETIIGIHYYEEQKLLLSTDSEASLVIWKVFPEFQVLKSYKIYNMFNSSSEIWRILQISKTEFILGERCGRKKGILFKITYHPKKEDFEITKLIEPFENRTGVFFLFQLKSEKDSIVFSDGYNIDVGIKKYDLKKKTFLQFPLSHDENKGIVYLTSYYNNQNTEVILSAGENEKIVIWTTDGKVLKEIKIEFEICLLDRKRKMIIFVKEGEEDDEERDFYTYSLETEKQEKILKNIHKEIMYCMKWINENESILITCSDSEDDSFCIIELEKFENSVFAKKDLEERISFFKDESFLDSPPKNKSIFTNVKLRNVEFEKLLRVLFL